MRLLVIEDERQLALQLQTALQTAGYAIDLADNGIDAEHLGLVEPYAAIVLDIGLPQRDGLSVLAAWRRQRMDRPVLLLTARASWQEKVRGIDAGADDYLAKPFQMEELLSRLRALIRRSAGLASAVLHQGQGAVALDTRACALAVDGRRVPLTGHEYRVLAYLLHHRGRTVGRLELAEHVYSQDADRDSNTLDVFVARLRRKLPSDFIVTVRGLGWRIGGPSR
jgi:two-component system OmpR family response regulator